MPWFPIQFLHRNRTYAPCNFSPLSGIFALVLCTTGDNLVWLATVCVYDQILWWNNFSSMHRSFMPAVLEPLPTCSRILNWCDDINLQTKLWTANFLCASFKLRPDIYLQNNMWWKLKKKYVQRLFWNSNLVVFVFYGLSTLFMSFQARLVNLSTLFLGKPPRQPAHYFASNWQLPFLNQRKWENGFRNNFMTNLHKGMSPDVRTEPATVRIPGTRIWPSYRALLELNVAFRFVFSI